jgi:hypothetical protein
LSSCYAEINDENEEKSEADNLTRRKFAICAFDAGASVQGRVFIDID